MSETITLNGVDRSSVIQRKNLELAENAYLGEVATGRAQIDDAAGTITVAAYKSATVEQSSSTPSRIFSGFTHRKGIRRGETYTTGAGREYDVTLVDGNDLLRRIKLRGSEANRKESETVSERVDWLLGTGWVLASDFGAVASSDIGMDPADLRGMYPGDVLAECAKAARFNFYVRWNTDEADWELVFRDDNTSTDDTCTLSISNDPTEIDEDTVFAPYEEAELSQDPEDVYSDVFGAYKKGHITETRAATATAFTERWGTTEDSGTKNEATARRDAQLFLHESKDEEQMLPVTIRLDKTRVGLIQAGQRIAVHMTHMDPEGWGNALDSDPLYARILRLRKTQPLNTDDIYDLSMDLSPQEEAPAVGAIVQSAFGRGGNGGLSLSLPNPVTIGNTLVCIISTKLDRDPEHPNTTVNLPRWGAGAWTRFNGANLTGPNTVAGMSAWYKTADSTETTGYISEQNPGVAIFELSGADPASATIEYEDQTAGGPNYDIGSAQTPAVGDIAIAAWSMSYAIGDPEWSWDYQNSYAWQTPNPNPGLAAGWTLDYSHWVSDGYSLDAYLPHSPWTVFAHALGAGASLTARCTPGESHNFGGLYIVIPPA